MALSMDEQRVLAEIERRLAADDPGLATCLTSFRRPGPATVLRSPRARILGSLFTVLLVTMVSLMVYAMIPFRTHGARIPAPSASVHGAVASTAAGTTVGSQTLPVSSNASAEAGTAARSSGKSATPSAGASAVTRSIKGAKSQSAPTATGPLPGAAKDSRTGRG
jgi:cytoskeletal protein RodZ